MDFKVNAVHFSADQKLLEYIHGKVKKLEMIADITSKIILPGRSQNGWIL